MTLLRLLVFVLSFSSMRGIDNDKEAFNLEPEMTHTRFMDILKAHKEDNTRRHYSDPYSTYMQKKHFPGTLIVDRAYKKQNLREASPGGESVFFLGQWSPATPRPLSTTTRTQRPLVYWTRKPPLIPYKPTLPTNKEPPQFSRTPPTRPNITSFTHSPITEATRHHQPHNPFKTNTSQVLYNQTIYVPTTRLPTCHIQDYEILYNGRCEKLLSSGSCEPNQWLVQIGSHPECILRPCPPKHALFTKNNTCIRIISNSSADSTLCPADRYPSVTFGGTIICMCKIGYVDWEITGKCYRPYTRGPCRYTEYLKMDSSGVPVCVDNPCREGEVPLKKTIAISAIDDDYLILKNESFGCYKLNDGEACQSSGILSVNHHNFQLSCNPLSLKQIFRIGASKCSSGYTKSLDGRCKRGVPVADLSSAYKLFFG